LQRDQTYTIGSGSRKADGGTVRVHAEYRGVHVSLQKFLRWNNCADHQNLTWLIALARTTSRRSRGPRAVYDIFTENWTAGDPEIVPLDRDVENHLRQQSVAIHEAVFVDRRVADAGLRELADRWGWAQEPRFPTL
jgi:hypothetical protein